MPDLLDFVFYAVSFVIILIGIGEIRSANAELRRVRSVRENLKSQWETRKT